MRVSDYTTVIRKRMQGILLPYILWNIVAFLASMILSPKILFPYTNRNIIDVLFLTIKDVFISPAIEPLWFLRNLFLLLIAMPLLQKMIRINKWMSLLVFCLIENFTFLGGIFYFGIGLIAAGCDQNKLYHVLNKLGLASIVLYSLIIAVETKLRIDTNSIWLLQIAIILIGIIGVSSIGLFANKKIHLLTLTLYFLYIAFMG